MRMGWFFSILDTRSSLSSTAALSEAGIRQFGGVSGEAVIRGGIMRREKWKETCFSVRIRKNPITER